MLPILWPLLLVYDILYFLFLKLFGFGGSVRVSKTINKICVIGSGPSGILAARYVIQYLPKCELVIYEGLNEAGGSLRYTEESPTSPNTYNIAGYDCMVTNNSKEMMSFSAYPMDSNLPAASIPGNAVVSYYEDVIKRLDLRKFIKFNTTVTKITRTEATWIVKTSRGEDLFDAVIVCTGRLSKPKFPSLPGANTFPGLQLHSRYYRNSQPFKNKKVVVVGSGHSAADVCISLSKTAQSIFLSVNRLPIFVDRASNNIPFDHTKQRFYIPYYHPKKYYQLYCNIVKALKTQYEQKGINYPTLRETTFVLNDVQKLVGLFATGKVNLTKEIKSISKSTITFESGDEIEADAIVYATGYQRDYFPFFEMDVAPLLYQRVFFIPDPTLSFVGLVHTTSTIPNAEMQAIWIAKYLSGQALLPDQQTMEMKKSLKDDHPRYMDKIAVACGVYPSFWKRATKLTKFYFGITSTEALIL